MRSFPGSGSIIVLFIFILSFSCSQSDNRDHNSVHKNEIEKTEIPESNRKSSESTAQPGKTTQLNSLPIEMDTILGPWIRPDGNYILEFIKINDDKSLEANYYNPNPIHISLAQIKQEDRIKIYVEFDDVNYRGSYYDLLYDPVNDALTGNYYQATYGQTYAIAFIRYKQPD